VSFIFLSDTNVLRLLGRSWLYVLKPVILGFFFFVIARSHIAHVGEVISRIYRKSAKIQVTFFSPNSFNIKLSSLAIAF